LADLIDNSASITKYDPSFAKVYMKEKKELLEVLDKGDKNLYKKAEKIIGEFYA
jgi:predicted GTPase